MHKVISTTTKNNLLNEVPINMKRVGLGFRKEDYLIFFLRYMSIRKYNKKTYNSNPFFIIKILQPNFQFFCNQFLHLLKPILIIKLVFPGFITC